MQLFHLLSLHFLLSQTCNLSLFPFFLPLPLPFPPSLCESWLLQTFDPAAL